MKHSFQSAIAEGVDPTLVGPTEWNAVHKVGITALSANTTLTAAHDFVPVTGGAGVTITLPPAAASAGLRYEIKKVDAAAGAVTVAANAAELIDDFNTYILSNKNQFLIINCDGSKWHIVGRN